MNTSIQQLVHLIDSCIRVVTLLMVFLLPVAFISNDAVLCSEVACGHYLPKILILRIGASFTAILLLIKLCLRAQYGELVWQPYRNVMTMIRSYPFVVVLVCLIIGTAISSVLSVSVDSSVWGRVPMSDGTSMYNILSMVVIGIGVAMTINSPVRINQFVMVMVLSGVLVAVVGLAQFYLVPGDGLSVKRINSTLPNPLQAGSYFVFSIGFSVIFMHKLMTHLDAAMYYVSSTGLLLVQVMALALTQSRGPIIVTFVMLFFLTAMLWYFSIRKYVFRIAIPVIASVAISIVILSLSTSGIDSKIDVISEGSGSVVSTLQGRFQSSVDTPSSGGIQSRLGIWSDSFSLLFEPDQHQALGESYPLARIIWGFGPGTFAPMSGISTTPNADGSVNKYLYAHNVLVQWVVELGVWGMSLNILLFLTVGLTFTKFISGSNPVSSFHKLMATGLFILLIFHLLDQMVNVTSIVDCAYRWLVFGLMFHIMYGLSNSDNDNFQILQMGRESRILRISIQSLGVTLIGLIIIVLWFKSINYSVAAIYASDAQQSFASNNFLEANNKIDSAIRFGPSNYSYYNWKSEILEGSLVASPFDLACSIESSNYRQCIAQKLLASDMKGAEVRPLELTPTVEAANSALKAISFGLDNRDEFIRYANRAQLIAPGDWELKNWLGMAYMNLGMLQEADHLLSLSYDITQGSSSSSQGLLLQGLLRQELGLIGDASDYYTKVIDLAADSDMAAQAYNNRGMIFRQTQQYEKALYDFTESLGLVGESAEVHNNLGGLYLDNNRMSEALTSFSRAIYVNNNYAPAYYNRALVFASMGNATKSFEDAYRAGELGMDVDGLLIELENMIEAYRAVNLEADK